MTTKRIISIDDIITSHAKTRDGFVAMALEKNNLATPYVEEAKALKNIALRVNCAEDLIGVADIRSALCSAAGLSEKAASHLDEHDHEAAIREFVRRFLVPAGSSFIDELVYRFLLTKGDALGGKARNLAGVLGERKMIRTLMSVLGVAGISFAWKDESAWQRGNDFGAESRVKAICWCKKRPRLLLLNRRVPIIDKNIDIVVCEGEDGDLPANEVAVLSSPNKVIALGELKGGIDPAGADEHWKTANSALHRIRDGFRKHKLSPQTFFIGAATERAMAKEICDQLATGTLQQAANLTNDEQLTTICQWIVNL